MNEKVLLYAGTTEGRELCDFLGEAGIPTVVYVATEYGEQLLNPGPQVSVRTGRLCEEEMEQEIARECPTLVLDATHPYAKEATLNIKAACGHRGIPYLRVLREQERIGDASVLLESLEEAAQYFNIVAPEGRILVTTGSQGLSSITEKMSDKSRLVVRILPSAPALQQCQELGLSGRQILCMQGPVSEEMNYAVMKEYKISYLLTKNSGIPGGFSEKLRAAVRAGVKAVVVRPPEEEEGCTVEEIKKRWPIFCRKDSSRTEGENAGEEGAGMAAVQNIDIVGIGMGCWDGMTLRAKAILEQAQVIIGAGRLLETYRALMQEAHQEATLRQPDKAGRETADGAGIQRTRAAGGLSRSQVKLYEEYRPREISRLVREGAPENVAILVSGDTGFYSAAKAVLSSLQNLKVEMGQKRDISIRVEPGISSLSYFASRIAISWEDAEVISLHGRSQSLVLAVKKYTKLFVLTHGQIKEICDELCKAGLGDVRLYVGESLSYPQERIWKGTPSSYSGGTTSSLSVLLILSKDEEVKAAEDAGTSLQGSQPVPGNQKKRYAQAGLWDTEFLREQVPMTKSEIRAVILSRLALMREDIVYDIGAGTGSVSIEMAIAADRGVVYAVEAEDKAQVLLERNRQKFGCENIRILSGFAPEALEGLPAPDAVFIGGSKGRLLPVLKKVLSHNKKVRIVVSAVTMETASAALHGFQELSIDLLDACLISVARLPTKGPYHMMQAQNPVFLITGEYAGKISGAGE